jgi:hypothetical protein
MLMISIMIHNIIDSQQMVLKCYNFLDETAHLVYLKIAPYF